MQAWLLTHCAARASDNQSEMCVAAQYSIDRSSYTGTGQDRRPMERGCVPGALVPMTSSAAVSQGHGFESDLFQAHVARLLWLPLAI